MPAPTIYYIRHGETDWNAEGRLQGTLDIPLNELGRRQAVSAGIILAGLLARDGHGAAQIPFVASPLGRARLTMELVRSSLKLPPDGYATHEVMNQATPLVGHNAFAGDRLLTEIAAREPIAWAEELLTDAGKTVASARVAELARDANRHGPELRSHDRFGNRIDQIEFHPAWHELMSLAIGHGTHALSWTAKKPGAHVARGEACGPNDPRSQGHGASRPEGFPVTFLLIHYVRSRTMRSTILDAIRPTWAVMSGLSASIRCDTGSTKRSRSCARAAFSRPTRLASNSISGGSTRA